MRRHAKKDEEPAVEIPIESEPAPAEEQAAAAAGAEAPAADLLRALEEEKKKFEDLWLRARAELDNFRKRTLREQEERERRAAERVLLALLEIQDNLDKALAAVSGGDAATGSDAAGSAEARLAALHRGVELIHAQINALLAREGVTPIEARGALFDPRLHEAAMRVEGGGQASDTVVEVIQKGYLLGDRLLRPARVTVAR